MPSHDVLVNFLDKELTEMVDYLKTLPKDAWDKPSACEFWTANDLMGQMVYVMEMVTGGISRYINGDTTQIEGWPADGTYAATRDQFMATVAKELTEGLAANSCPLPRYWFIRRSNSPTHLGPLIGRNSAIARPE